MARCAHWKNGRCQGAEARARALLPVEECINHHKYDVDGFFDWWCFKHEIKKVKEKTLGKILGLEG